MRRWREHVVDGAELPRVDRGFAEEAERAGELGLLAQTAVVAEARIDAVDRRPEAGRARGHDDMRAGVQRLQVAVAGAEVSSQVDAAHGQVPDPRYGRDLRGGEQPPGVLDRADHRHTRGAVSYPLDVVSGLGLRDPDPGGVPGDGVEVGGGQVGTDRIDPHPRGLIGQNISDHRACPLLGIRGDGVLQVEYHRVRACLEHPAQQFGVVAWGEQVAAVHQIAPSARSSATRWGSRPSHSP